jgi:hypothetical protein
MRSLLNRAAAGGRLPAAAAAASRCLAPAVSCRRRQRALVLEARHEKRQSAFNVASRSSAKLQKKREQQAERNARPAPIGAWRAARPSRPILATAAVPAASAAAAQRASGANLCSNCLTPSPGLCTYPIPKQPCSLLKTWWSTAPARSRSTQRCTW